jgi:hypothetical protein
VGSLEAVCSRRRGPETFAARTLEWRRGIGGGCPSVAVGRVVGGRRVIGRRGAVGSVVVVSVCTCVVEFDRSVQRVVDA